METENQIPNHNPNPEIQDQVSKIQDLAAEAASVESSKQLFKPEKKGKARGPYKPRAGKSADHKPSQQPAPGPDAQQAQAPVALPSREVVKPFITVIDGWTQRMIDPACAMKAEEADGMATGLGMILDKYMPTVMDKYAPEFVFFSCASAWGLRCYAIAKVKSDRKREEYKAKVESQQRNLKVVDSTPKPDPNPNLNGHDELPNKPPTEMGPSYKNPFSDLPKQ